MKSTTLAIDPIITYRKPFERQPRRFISMHATCGCGGRMEVYAADLSYCQSCGAEHFIVKGCSRHGQASTRPTGRVMR